MIRSLSITKETWKLKEPFTISRVSMTESYILVVELAEDGIVGRGECEPHESDPSFLEAAESILENHRETIENGLTRNVLNLLLPAGPVRNAIDCALWDLECKKSNRRAWEIAEIQFAQPLVTAYTICLESDVKMAAKAAKNNHRKLLKLKLGAENSIELVSAVRKQAPESCLIVDANEAWSYEQLLSLAPELDKLGVALIEQPLPAGKDHELEDYTGPVPLCADESCLDRNSLSLVKKRYEFINIKLDKTGGLTEALLLAEEAKAQGLRLMVGCMTGTSLAMAPAMLIGAMAEFCDLDGPLLLEEDRDFGLKYDQSFIGLPNPKLWG